MGNGRPGYTFVAESADNGKPGRGLDTFSVTVRNPQGEVVLQVSGVLTAGNVELLQQIAEFQITNTAMLNAALELVAVSKKKAGLKTRLYVIGRAAQSPHRRASRGGRESAARSSRTRRGSRLRRRPSTDRTATRHKQIAHEPHDDDDSYRTDGESGGHPSGALAEDEGGDCARPRTQRQADAELTLP